MRKNIRFIIMLMWCSLFLMATININILGSDNNRIYAGTAKVDYTPALLPDSLIHYYQFIRVLAFSDGE